MRRQNTDKMPVLVGIHDTGAARNGPDKWTRWRFEWADGSFACAWGLTPEDAAPRAYGEIARKSRKAMRRALYILEPKTMTAEVLRVARLGRVTGERSTFRLVGRTWVEERHLVWSNPDPHVDDSTPRSRGGLTVKPGKRNVAHCSCGDAATFVYMDEAERPVEVVEDGALLPDALVAPVCQICGKPAHSSIARRATLQAEREASRRIKRAEDERLERARKSLLG